jgi:GNAT superfamily N-acetyltransferase
MRSPGTITKRDASIRVRPARQDEAEALSALCLRSKAHWGYDAVFLAQCVDSLRVATAAIRSGNVFVAAGDNDRPLAVCELAIDDAAADLAKLFVDPSAIGHGIGRRLFAHAVQRARAAGCREMTILSDPNAAAFYAAMGATFARMAPSDSVPGRVLPLYRLVLASGGAATFTMS